MNKTQFIEVVALKSGLKKKEAEAAPAEEAAEAPAAE